MKITRDVIQDLLPAYLAEEASSDTIALVDEFLRQDPELVRMVEALRANPLPDLPTALRPTQEKETLNMTKRLLRLRGILLGLAIFVTMLPLSFEYESGRFTWKYLHVAPPETMILMVLAALACWGGFLYVRHRLQGTAL
jgi:hypothetical protein